MEPPSMRFTWTFTVGSEPIDVHGHVNNVAYVRWMQDLAIRHTQSEGSDVRAAAAGIIWVARSHKIEYLRPAFEGNEIQIQTWIETVERVTSLRKYEFRNTEGEVLLAKGETSWVCLDRETGRPRAIPDRVIQAYTEPGDTP